MDSGHIGFTAAITSMVFFMAMFIAAYLVFIRQKTFDDTIAKGKKMVEEAIARNKEKAIPK